MKEQEKILLVGQGRKEKTSYRKRFGQNTAVTWLLLIGMLGGIRTLMPSQTCYWIALGSGMAAVVAAEFSQRKGQAGKALSVALYVGPLIVFLLRITFVLRGFLISLNRLILLWNIRFGTEIRTFQVNGTGSWTFWGLSAFVISYFLLWLIQKNKIVLMSIFIIADWIFGFFIGQSAMWGSAISLFFVIIVQLCRNMMPEWQIGNRGIALSAFFLFSICFFSGVASFYEGSDSLEAWKQDTKKWVEEVRYGKDTLPRGNLYQAQKLLSGEEDTLKVTIDHPQELYLRGFVGGTYEGISWETLAGEAYQGDYQGMLEWLEKKNFFPLTQYMQYEQIFQESTGAIEKKTNVSVENVGAYRKYAYLPYASSFQTRKLNLIRDWYVKGGGIFGAKNYEFQTLQELPFAGEKNTYHWISDPSGQQEVDYANAESVYHSFVEDSYLTISAKQKEEVEKLFGKAKKDEKFRDLTNRIRRVLRKNTNYKENPQRLPEGEDFIHWFLKEGKEGNAVHYASAAVMAYRAAGYPARYVEGYLLTEEKAKEMKKRGVNTTTLTNQDAHAWVEVYLTGSGWMPVEVVPGFYTETYSDQKIEGRPTYSINSQKKKNGLNANTDNQKKNKTKGYAQNNQILQMLIENGKGLILMFVYFIFMIYLVLELQRWLRIRILISQKEMLTAKDLPAYIAYMNFLFQLGGMVIDGKDPESFIKKLQEHFPDIPEEEFQRVSGLIDKVMYGGKDLVPYERHILNAFLKRLQRSIYQRKGILYHLKVKYYHAIPGEINIF